MAKRKKKKGILKTAGATAVVAGAYALTRGKLGKRVTRAVTSKIKHKAAYKRGKKIIVKRRFGLKSQLGIMDREIRKLKRRYKRA